jgi:hypothetical protein
MNLRPQQGGFLRPFGCGWFIREFLLGHGPYDSPKIDPDVGAPQADIHRFYKQALHRSYAEDAVALDEEERIKKGLPPFTAEEADKRTEYYLSRIPYKLTCCRFHSFVVYFSNLQRLGWVEFTGQEEPSMFQEHYLPGPPRKYFRLTKAGREAPDEAWSNPLFWLYRDRWSREHLRELRKRHKYIKAKRR